MKNLITLLVLIVAATISSAQVTFNRSGNHVAITKGTITNYISVVNSHVKSDPRDTVTIVIASNADPQREREGIRFSFTDVTEFSCTTRQQCIDSIFITYFKIAQDVGIVDQTTRAIFNPFCKVVTGPYTLADNTVPNSDTLVLNDATGLNAGDKIGLFQDSSNPSSFFSFISSISNNTLILTDPLDVVFDTLVTPVLFELDCNINDNGSSTRVIFKIDNDSEQTIDITRILLQITDDAAMDDGTFGGITALTRGILFRKKNADNTYINYWTARTNGDLKNIMYDVNYSSKAPAGTYGLTGRLIFAGQEKIGVAIRLQQNEELQLLVQDDLSGLTTFNIMAEGHFTTIY